jgi:ElaA protein
MDWKIKKYSELEVNELYELLQLRSEVFVVEQDCVYQDIDGKDQIALHVLGYQGKELIAYARIFKKEDYFKESSIGRIIVKETYRSKDVGHRLLDYAISYINFTLNENSIRISAQKYLIAFYQKHGFQVDGEGYLEDGIPHVNMLM